MKKRSPVAVIGLGSQLFQDEAAGFHALSLLEKKYPDIEADIIYAETQGLSLLHQFEERKKIIFIDAGNCGVNPGEFRQFSVDEVETRKSIAGFSLHEFDLIRFLNYAEEIGFSKGVEVTIFCVQIKSMKLSDSLSREVLERLPTLVDAVYREIQKSLTV